MHKITFKIWHISTDQCTKYTKWRSKTKIESKIIHKTYKTWFKVCSETEFKLRKKVFPIAGI